ncbi:MAG: tetratricopeptide repeat protein [Flavobacteriales bacterium]|nr:tetratricopeptide repeat protein [Flavobacteriales bacterium]
MKSLVLILLLFQLFSFAQIKTFNEKINNPRYKIEKLISINKSDTISKIDKYFNLIDIGVCYFKLGDINMSYEHHTKASTLIKDLDVAYSYKANIEIFQYKNYASGLKSIKKAIKHNKFNGEIIDTMSMINYYVNCAFCYEKIGKYKSAIKLYNKLILLDPNNSEHLIDRGINFYNLGLTEEACEDFKKAILLGNKILLDDFGITCNH